MDGSPPPNSGDIDVCPEPQPEPGVQIKEKRSATKRSSGDVASFDDEDETPKKIKRTATPPEENSG